MLAQCLELRPPSGGRLFYWELSFFKKDFIIKPMRSTTKQLLIATLFVFLMGALVVTLSLDLPSSEGKDKPKRVGTTSKKEKNLKGVQDKATFKEENWRLYQNDNFNFSFLYPGDWSLATSSADSKSPQIILTKNDISSSSPPLANRTQVLVYPKGNQIDLPEGQREQAQFNLNLKASEKTAYLLENKEMWALKLAFQDPPQSWSEEGFIFGRARVDNLEEFCQKDNGEVASSSCKRGQGGWIYKGKVKKQDRQNILRVLNTIQFRNFEENAAGNDLLEIDSPKEKSTVSSPLKVEGKARGIWFIDGGFPVYLKTATSTIIASTTAKATTKKEGFATSTDFVSFGAELEFQKPSVEEAKLILEEPGVSGFSTEPARKEVTLYFED